MKTKITPGAMLEHLSPEEFLKHGDAQNDMLLKLLGKNAVFRRVVVSAPFVAGQVPRIVLAPPTGFMWEVHGVSYSSPANAAFAGLWCLNEFATINQFAGPQTQANGIINIPGKYIVVHSGDYLTFGSTAAIVSSDQVTCLLLVIEVPSAHEAQLLI